MGRISSFYSLIILQILFVFGYSTSFANIAIRDAGCYVVQGKLKAFFPKKMQLVVNAQARSELHLNISPSSSHAKLKPGLIETVVYFKKGPVQNNVSIVLSEKQTKNIKASEISSAKQWTWMGEGKSQKCL